MDFDIKHRGKKYPHRWNVPKHLRYKSGGPAPFVGTGDGIMDRRDLGKYNSHSPQYESYDAYLKAGNNKSYQSYEQLKRSYDLWIADASDPAFYTSQQEWYTRERRDW
jgi:hypothetical protein